VSSTPELPSGTVTFLFTDIEGSTRLLRELGERYADVLAEHQRVLREVFAEHGGREIDTQGDSFFVAFRRAKDAIAAAVDAQRALVDHDWPEGAQVRVRMGIHTGEPVVGEQRYVGLGVHRAARVSAVGHGGQVLVSGATRELVEDDLPPGLTLRDLGVHRLKDIERPERIFQVVAEGLASKFAPLKTAGGPGRRRFGRRVAFVLVGAVTAAGATLGAVLATVGGSGTARASSVAPNSVGVINSKNGEINGEIAVGAAPGAVAVSRDAVWVTNTDGNSVSRIDPKTNDVRQTVDVGGGPSGVAIGGGAVWVANGLDGTVSRIDPTANKVVQTTRVGNGPSGVAYGEKSVWVTNSADGTVSRIDPATGHVTRTLPAAMGAAAVAVAFGRIWVVSGPSGMVAVLDPRSGAIRASIGVGADPSAIAVDSHAVWVANRANGTVSEIDPQANAVTNTYQVGNGPDAVAAAAQAVWVSNGADGTLSRIDPQRGAVVNTVKLANPPQGLALSPDGLYVAVRSTGREHRGGTVTVVQIEPADSIDPAVSYSVTGWEALIMTNDGLLTFRRVGGVQGIELVPDVAVSLPTPTDGGTTYTFRLRSGIRYSTGRLVQPDDFRREIERVFEVGSPGAPFYGGIVGAKTCLSGKGRCDLSAGIVTDRVARTVSFHLTAPDAEFLDKLALPFAVAVPAGTPARDVGTHPVPATGPYRIASYRPGRDLRVVRNRTFREWSSEAQPQGYPDVVVFRSGFDQAKQVRMVEKGAVDYAFQLDFAPAQLIERLATRYPTQLHVNTREETHYMFLNTRVPPFDNLLARRAANMAVDRAALIRQMSSTTNAPTCQVLPPNLPGYRPYPCLESQSSVSVLQAARRLVHQSGTTGAPVVVWTFGPFIEQARYFVSVLEVLGYRARLKIVPPNPKKPGIYFDAVSDSRTRAQAGSYGWLMDFPSAATFLRVQFSCGAFTPAAPHATTNVAEFCDRHIDALIDHAAAVQAEDPPAASVLWPQVEKAILNKAPIVPTINPSTVTFVSKRLGNYQFNPQWGPLLDQAWVK
jgi:peptide/nickel transport system substrate-binding protein